LQPTRFPQHPDMPHWPNEFFMVFICLTGRMLGISSLWNNSPCQLLKQSR